MAEIIQFAEQWDPQLFHIDVEVAEAGYFGGIIGSGLHSLSIFQRLSVLNLYREWEVIAGRRIHDIQFTTPLRPGVTVQGSVTVEAVVATHPERALVTTRGELHTADGGSILTIVADSYVRRRQAAPAPLGR
ncbi:hypothetical protein B7R54_04210 [Subtercola boreus]|uniref:MaoC-like domain-containing protein n=2 Tax=Subtercola boreus TaxID=120213 RepID=A0A3E0VMB1_9MICO|nr:hypothetical protein B7R54_04210 [Subtercola boreus]